MNGSVGCNQNDTQNYFSNDHIDTVKKMKMHRPLFYLETACSLIPASSRLH